MGSSLPADRVRAHRGAGDCRYSGHGRSLHLAWSLRCRGRATREDDGARVHHPGCQRGWRIIRAPLAGASASCTYAWCVRPPGSRDGRGERPDGDRAGRAQHPRRWTAVENGRRTGARCGGTGYTGSVADQHPASGQADAAAERPFYRGPTVPRSGRHPGPDGPSGADASPQVPAGRWRSLLVPQTGPWAPSTSTRPSRGPRQRAGATPQSVAPVLRPWRSCGPVVLWSCGPVVLHRPRAHCCQPTNSPTAALSSDRPFFASAKNMPALGLV